jgi:hypothetical protein
VRPIDCAFALVVPIVNATAAIERILVIVFISCDFQVDIYLIYLSHLRSEEAIGFKKEEINIFIETLKIIVVKKNALNASTAFKAFNFVKLII